MAGRAQEYCKRGHLMADTRKTLANGNTYCNECKKIRYRTWKNQPEGKEKLRKVRRNYYLKLRYDVTLDEFDEKLDSQFGRCAICGCVPDNGKGPVLDHDHKTGKPRGILCHYCNTGLGHFREDLTVFNGATNYLQQYRGSDLKRLDSLLSGYEVEFSDA